ncbi:MAG: hypothetical protein KDC98_26810 [Planctomycetes bacterium]|nr:hypothetical protein [Planctomycetota bacterium]
MRCKLLLPIAMAAVTATAAGQDFLGFVYNTSALGTFRGSLGVRAGEIVTRVDGDEYAGWGVATPGFRSVSSVFMIIQDQDASTPDNFDVLLYPEDASNPGFPDLSAGVMFASAVSAPTGSGAVALGYTLTPSTPVAVPIVGSGDVFVAFRFAAAPQWPLDGLSSHFRLGWSSPLFSGDIPGRAQHPLLPPGPDNSHALTVFANAAAYEQRCHWFIDVAHDQAGGVALAITNQTAYPGSFDPPPLGFGPAPGMAGFMSGVSPDASQFDPTRADNVTMDYYRTGSGSPLVVFLYDCGGFGPEQPFAFALPGSTGALCVKTGYLVAGFVRGSGDEAYMVTRFPGASRAFIAGLELIQQAVEFDFAAGLVHGSPCSRQRL